MMKLTVVTFGILLAITSGVVQGVDLPWVALEFITGISRQKLPEQVVQGVNTEDFRNQFVQLITSAIARNAKSYHEQVFSGIKVIKANLPDLIEKITSSQSENIEVNLKSVNELMQDVVELMPAKVTVGSPSLPDLPPAMGPIDAVVTNKTASEIMHNFPSIIERDLAAIRKFMDHLYMAGWSQARNFYTLDQNSIKNTFRRSVVPFILEKLEKVNDNADTIRGQVSSGVWDDFTRLNEALKAANIDKS